MLIEQLRNVWVNWNFDLPVVIQILLAGCVILSLAFHRSISRFKVPFQIIALVWNFIISILTRRSMDRVWLYLLPFWLIWASGGFVALLGHFHVSRQQVQVGLVAAMLVAAAAWSVQRVHAYFPGWQADPGKVERAAQYLSKNLQKGDAIAVVFPYDAPYWYYLKQDGVADIVMNQIDDEDHARVFAVVNSHEVDGPATVLKAQGLSPEEYQVDQRKWSIRSTIRKFICVFTVKIKNCMAMRLVSTWYNFVPNLQLYVSPKSTEVFLIIFFTLTVILGVEEQKQ
jgi:hypothetical protein